MYEYLKYFTYMHTCGVYVKETSGLNVVHSATYDAAALLHSTHSTYYVVLQQAPLGCLDALSSILLCATTMLLR